jgi:hypothetical protein
VLLTLGRPAYCGLLSLVPFQIADAPFVNFGDMKQARRAFRDVADQSSQCAQIGGLHFDALSQCFVPFD